MPFQVGQRVGDYEVVQMLGAGGMGHVYRVRNIISNRTEAMKVLLPDLTAEPDLATRFISEIRTLASFDHPNIAQLHTALLAENQLIMMMEFVEGYTLEQMAKQRTLPVNEVAGYLSQVLSALAYAHQRGVVHRDIKPANLMVTTHGIVKLMDFGIAKSNSENVNHTRPGTTIGSIYYMSPEQVRGSTVDPRSDLYSLGVVLYELLAGRRPFEADSTFSILNQQLNVLPRPPRDVNAAVPQAMSEVILKALAKEPAERFQNAEEFRAALRPFLDAPGGQQVVASGVGPDNVATATGLPPIPPLSAVPQANLGPPSPSPAHQAKPGVPPPRPQPTSVTGRSASKVIWIATGAIAAVLALVIVAFALPSLLKRTRAASTSSTPPASLTAPASTDANSTNATAPPVAAVPVAGSGSGSSGVAGGQSMPQSPADRPHEALAPLSAPGSSPNRQAPPDRMSSPVHASAPGSAGSGSPAPIAPVSSAELEQAEERMTQLSARAGSAKRAVDQIRSQQETEGLGMRGDVESAESRLTSYLNNANAALARGDGPAATRALDKADVELAQLEKFLGH